MSRDRPAPGERGFTLIELLVVVVITATLASLMIPRFVGQTERAYIAEPHQMLGVIVRAQNDYLDLSDQKTYFRISSEPEECPENSPCAARWARLNLRVPRSGAFTYHCYAASAEGGTNRCVAVRMIEGVKYGEITLGSDGHYSCSGNYTAVDPGTDNRSVKGCYT